MAAGDPLPDLKARVEALRSGAIPSAPPGPGPVTPLTWALLGIGVASALVGSAAEFAGGAKNEGCLTAGVVIGFIFFFISLVGLAVDFATPAPKSRTTPERAVKAFYGALRRKSYKRAYACLSPLDRTLDLRPTQAIERLSVPDRSYDFHDLKSFTQYGGDQSALANFFFGGYHKTLRADVGNGEAITDRVAAVDVRISLSGYPPLTAVALLCGVVPALIMIALMTRNETFYVRKLVVEKDGLWWIVNGEFSADGDEAIERLLATKR